MARPTVLLTPAASLGLLCLVVLAYQGLQVQAMVGAPGLHALLGGQRQQPQSQAPAQQPFTLPGSPSPPIEEMFAWIKQQGGMVNVAVRELPGVGRVTLALQHISQGDILAAIPRRTCFAAERNEWDSAAKLWREMRNSTSSLAPYMQGLPLRSQVASYYTLPASYLPLIQNEAMVHAIQQVQQQLHDVAEQQAGGVGVEAHESGLRYAMSLLKTRSFDCAGLGELLLPVVDLANHRNGCPHSITTYKDCGPLSPDGCVVWRAEEAVRAGEEVCNSYHSFMLQDRALLQYGMLQEGEPARMLSGIDRHDFDPRQPWAFQDGREMTTFTGDAAQMAAEASRLSALLADMQVLDRTLQVQPDATADPGGVLLGRLQEWRQQRQATITAEVQRLRCGLTSRRQRVA